MTSKISSTNLMKVKLKQNLWLPVLLMVGMFFTMILPIIMDQSGSGIMLYNPFIPIGAVVFSFVTPFVFFKYILNKPEVDFHHSLPVKRQKLFATNYLTGLLALLLPFTVFYWFGVLLCGGNWDSDIIPSFCHIIINSVAVYSFSTLAVIIAGNVFMSVILAIILNFILFGAYFSFTYLAESLLISYNSESLMISLTDFATSTSPMINMSFSYAGQEFLNIGFIAAFAVVATLYAFLLYMKRPSENAAQAVAIIKLKPIIKYACILVGSLLVGIAFMSITGDFPWLIIGILLMAIVINGIFEVIFEADFRACLKNIKFVFVYLILAVGVIMLLRFDVLGYDSKIPDADEVSSIEFSDLNYGSYYNAANVAKIESPENIEKTLFFIDELMEVTRQFSGGTNFHSRFTVTYNLQDGSSYSRSYPTNVVDNYDKYEDLARILLEVLQSEEYVRNLNNYDNLDIYKDWVYDKGYISSNERINHISVSSWYNGYDISVQNTKEQQAFAEFMDLISEESKELTDEYLLSHLSVMSVEIRTNRGNSHIIEIYDCFDKSIEFAKEQGWYDDLSKLKESMANDVENISNITLYSYYGDVAIDIYEKEDILSIITQLQPSNNYRFDYPYNTCNIGYTVGIEYVNSLKEESAYEEYYGEYRRNDFYLPKSIAEPFVSDMMKFTK